MDIEQKLQEIFVECAVRGKLCPRPDDCSSISCSECKIALVLALIQPQQPEGELAECPAKACSFKVVLPDGTRFICTAKECAAYEYAQAQHAHMIQQGWVKLPSEDELLAMVKESEVRDGDTVFVDVGILHRLLGEKP